MLLRSRKAVQKLHRNYPWGRGGIAEVVQSGRNEPRQISIIKFWTHQFIGKLPRGSVILDAGCNDGVIGRELIYQGHIVYGIDLNPDAIEIAKYRGLFASVCPVEKLTFQDNFFDVCLAFEIIEHLYNPEEGVKELYRVLKPSGVLLGSVPYPFGRFSQSSKHQHIWHQHDFTPISVKQVLQKFFKSRNIEINQKKISNKADRDKIFFRAVK